MRISIKSTDSSLSIQAGYLVRHGLAQFTIFFFSSPDEIEFTWLCFNDGITIQLWKGEKECASVEYLAETKEENGLLKGEVFNAEQKDSIRFIVIPMPTRETITNTGIYERYNV